MSGFEVGKDERVLVVLTHPDDELVLAAHIRRLAQSGTPIHLCWTHSTPVRERESRAAMSIVGVDDQSMTFLDAPDGRVIEHIPELVDRVRVIVGEFAPTRVYTNAFEQGHIDHDATNLVVNLCFDGPVFETPLYHTYLSKVPVLNRFSSPVGEEILKLTTDEIALKRRLVTMFPSQTVLRNVRLYSLVRALTFRAPDLFQTERCRLQTHKDFLKPNHGCELSARVSQSEQWRRWIAAVQPLMTS